MGFLRELAKAGICGIIILYLINKSLEIYSETGRFLDASGMIFASFVVLLFGTWFLKRAWHQFWYH